MLIYQDFLPESWSNYYWSWWWWWMQLVQICYLFCRYRYTYKIYVCMYVFCMCVLVCSLNLDVTADLWWKIRNKFANPAQSYIFNPWSYLHFFAEKNKETCRLFSWMQKLDQTDHIYLIKSPPLVLVVNFNLKQWIEGKV